MKESTRHLVFIDYLRGIAILCVFLYHCLIAAYSVPSLPWNWLTRDFQAPWSFLALLPVHFGYIGVPIFFVVSGFCIHLSFEQQGRDWKYFFIRRFFRIYPAYLAAMLIFSYCCTKTAHDFWRQLGFHALLIHNYNPKTFFGLSGNFWAIAIEAQLYLLYPLLILLVGKWGWKRTLFCAAACEILLHEWDALVYLIAGHLGIPSTRLLIKVDWFVQGCLEPSPLAYWFSWSLGALAADAFLKGRPMPLAKSSTWFWVFLVVVSYFFLPLWPHFFLLSALLTTKVIGNFLSSQVSRAEAPHFWLNQLRLIGVWSYSVYLLHAPLLDFLTTLRQHYFPHINSLIAFLAFVSSWLIIFPLAGIWYRVLEQPGIALGKRIIRKMMDKKLAIPANVSDG
jgi:peptidoglycan/LPS O-acetylase OafA/YrhL